MFYVSISLLFNEDQFLYTHKRTRANTDAGIMNVCIGFRFVLFGVVWFVSRWFIMRIVLR